MKVLKICLFFISLTFLLVLCGCITEGQKIFYFIGDGESVEYYLGYDSHIFRLNGDDVATETLPLELFPKKIGDKLVADYYWDEEKTIKCTEITYDQIMHHENVDSFFNNINIYCHTVSLDEGENITTTVNSDYPSNQVITENNKITFRTYESSLNINDLFIFAEYSTFNVTSSSYNENIFTFDNDFNDITATIQVTSLSKAKTSTYEIVIHKISSNTISFIMPNYPASEGVITKDFTKEDNQTEVYNENEILSCVNGYTKGAAIFEGWYTDKEFTNKVDLKDKDILSFDENKDFYGKFSYRTCIISFEGLDQTESYMFGTNIKIQYPDILVPKGYTFDGWKNGDIKFDKNGAQSLSDLYYCEKDITLKPVFKEIVYTIEFIDCENNKDFKIVDLPITSFPTLKAEWYEFKGWTTERGSKELITSIDEIGNITLYPVWEEKVFYANYYDGEVKITSISFTKTNSKWEDPVKPEKEGYTSSWESYKVKGEDLTIKVLYEPIKFKITYKNMIGENKNPSTYTILDDINIVLPEVPGYDSLYFKDENDVIINKIVKGTMGDITLTLNYEYHIFNVYYYDKEQLIDTKTYTLNNYSWDKPTCPTKDYYTTSWEAIPEKIPCSDININCIYTPIEYNISYENTKDVKNDNKTTYNIESEFNFLVLVKDGYQSTFKVNNENITGISKGMHGDLDIHIDWTPITYKVSFYAFNELIDTVTFTVENKTITVPQVPDKLYYQDGRWEDYTLGTSDIKVNAKYIPIDYKITYLGIKSATNPNPTTYNIESNDIILMDLTLEGNTFKGYKNNTGEFITTIKKGSFGDLTLTVCWDAPTYTINYYSTKDTIPYQTVTLGLGDYLSIPTTDPVLVDGTFKGWYNEDFSIKYDNKIIVTSDLNLYAKWDICISINTKEDLVAIKNDLTASYQLKDDINLKGDEWIPLETFTGVILGNNHKIYNFTISNNNEKSAFIIENNGEIKDITFTNVEYRLNHTGGGYSSIVSCINNGKIINVNVIDSFILVIYNHNSKSQRSHTGAIAAVNNGEINNCKINIELKTNFNGSFSNLSTYSYFTIGGVSGGNTAIIENCEVDLVSEVSDTVYHGISGYQSQSNETYSTYIYFGGICGDSNGNGSIKNSNCNLEVTVSSNANIGSSAFGGHGVHQRYRYIGGIVGNNEGIIEKCSSTGWIKRILSGEQPYNGINSVGGISGSNGNAALNIVSSKLKIINAEGIYGNFGGISGYSASGSSIKNSSYYGTIQLANSSNNINVGGLVGTNSGLISQGLMKGEIVGLDCNKGDLIGVNNADGTISKVVDEGNLGVLIKTDNGLQSKSFIMGVDVQKDTFYNSNYLFNEKYYYDEDTWCCIEGKGICLKQFMCSEHKYDETITEDQVCQNGYCGYIGH